MQSRAERGLDVRWQLAGDRPVRSPLSAWLAEVPAAPGARGFVRTSPDLSSRVLRDALTT